MASNGELLVGELMSRGAHTVSPLDPIDDVYRVMKLGGFRHVAVVEDGRLVGVVSDRDVLAAWTNGTATPVERVMTRTPRWIAADAPAKDAAATLLRHKIGCLPVVDEAMTVLGMVTETDFVELAHRTLGAEGLTKEPIFS